MGFEHHISINAKDHSDANMLSATVTAILKRYGLVKIRGVFEEHTLKPLVDHAAKFVGDMDSFRRGSMTETELKEKYVRTNPAGFSVNILALENTYGEKKEDIKDTLLMNAIASSKLLTIIRSMASYRMCCLTASVRCTFPQDAGLHPGGLKGHIEHSAYPGAHVVWVPLTAPGLICNRDVPGVGYLVRARPENEPISVTYEKAKHAAETFIYKTGNAHSTIPVDLTELGFEFTLPQVQLGDVLLFDGFMPHFSHYMEGANTPRASFDMRVLPESMMVTQAIPEIYNNLVKLDL